MNKKILIFLIINILLTAPLLAKQYTCEYCNMKFDKLIDYNAHIKTFHFICPLCKKDFVNPTKLNEHISRFHSNQFQCEYCGKIFSTLQALAVHKNVCKNRATHIQKNRIKVVKVSSLQPQNNYKRVISLAPNITEIIFYLKAENLLVGNTMFCDFPEKARHITKVGGVRISIENLLNLKPDLILTYEGAYSRRILGKLKKMGLNVKILKFNTIQDILNSIKLMGKILNREKRAQLLVNKFKEAFYVNSHNSSTSRKKVFIELFSSPLYTVGGNSFISELVEAVNLKNVFKDLKKEAFPVSKEAVLKSNPDYILVLHYSESKIASYLNAKIIKINPDIILRPGPRLLKAIDKLKKIIKHGTY